MPDNRINKLDPLTVGRAEKGRLQPRLYNDGGGLYLQVTHAKACSWIFRYQSPTLGKKRDMGLGSLQDIPLKVARERRVDLRQVVLAGLDPIEERKQGRVAAQLEAAKSVTFREAVDTYIEHNQSGWNSDKHAKQWRATLEKYAHPVIGDTPVQDIDTGLVVKVLSPIWTTKTDTASKVRGRIELVLDRERALGHREGVNPARWKGHLQNILPDRSSVAPVKHHPALPYVEIGDFMESVRAQEGISADALEFTILCASRTNEVIGAEFHEFDLPGKTWIVPAERMKGRKGKRKEHRVPLSDSAVAVIERMKELTGGEGYVFPGGKKGRPLSNMAMLTLLRRMERDDLTVHGFRSTFRDWVAEVSNHQEHIAEMALAHTIPDKVEKAYRRGDLFEKRRRLMDDWAAYCDLPNAPAEGGEVVPIRSAAE